MRIGVGIFLIALGAILRFALETTVAGINLDVTGVMLMVVGTIGLMISAAFWSSLHSTRHQPAARNRMVRDIPTDSVRNTEIV